MRLFLIAVVSATLGQPQSAACQALEPITDPEAYAIYAELLPSTWANVSKEVLLLKQETEPAMLCNEADAEWWAVETNLKAESARVRLLHRMLPVDVPKRAAPSHRLRTRGFGSRVGLEVSMTVGRSGWVVLGVFILGFELLMQAGKSGDLLLRGLIWGAILLAVGYQAVNIFRGKGHLSADVTAGLPASWRRWILGESNKS